MAGNKTNNIYINGKQAVESLRDIRSEARRLNNEIQGLAPGTEAYEKKVAELGKHQATLRKHSDEVRSAGQAMAKANTDAATRLEELNARMRSGTMDARQMQRALVEYQSIALEAGRTSPIGKQAIQDAAHYQDQLTDLRNEITRASHDGANMQAALQLGGTIVAGYGVAKGAMAALGMEGEDLQKTFVKLQAATTMLNGIEQIRANLEKESFLMMKAKALGTKVLTGVQIAYNAVVGTSTGLLKAFRLALVATGIGAIVVVVGSLIAYWEKLVGWVKQGVDWFNNLGTGVKNVLSIIFPFIGLIRAIGAAVDWLMEKEEEQDAERTKQAAAERARKREELKEAIRVSEGKIRQLEKEREIFDNKMNHEINKLRAAGKETIDIERQKRRAVIMSTRDQIRELDKLMEMKMQQINMDAVLMATNHKQQQELRELAKARKSLMTNMRDDLQEFEVFEIGLATESQKRREKAAEDRQKELDDLQKALEALQNKALEMQEERNRALLLQNMEAEMAEIQQKEWAIQAKFQKEIEAAQELAKQKGEIGQKAAQTLIDLETLQEDEIQRAKSEIKEKYRLKSIEDDKKAAAEARNAQIQIEDALMATREARIKTQISQLGHHEKEKRIELLNELEQIERDQAILKLERKKEEINLLLEEEKLTLEEHQILIEEAEAEHLLRLQEMKQEQVERDMAMDQQRFDNLVNLAKQATTALGQLSTNRENEELKRSNKIHENEIKNIENQLNRGIISREEYDSKISQLDQVKDQREGEIKQRGFKRMQAIQTVEASVNIAQAILKAIATYGPPPSPMGIAGIAVATGIGAAQIAAIRSQQVPQFAEGGFTVVGANDKKKYNAQYTGRLDAGMINGGPQLVLVNENNPEYFIPNPMLNHPEVVDHVRAIENIRLRQFNEGGSTAPIPQDTNQPVVDMEQNSEMKEVFDRNNELLAALLEFLPNLRVRIGDSQVADLMNKMDEINEIKN